MDLTAYALHAEVEERHWWFVARRQIIASVLRSLQLPRGAQLLEFGAGTGGNLPLLSRFGEIYAVEPSDEARRFSSARTPNAHHAASLDELPKDARFDAAFLFDVLEHLDEPSTMLRQIAAGLRPDARLVVTVPAHPFLFGAHDRYLHHRRRYTQSALRRDLEDGGFGVDALSPMNLFTFPAAVAARGLEWVRQIAAPQKEAQPRGMTVPPMPINRALTELFAVERLVLPERRLPFGLSLLATATARR